MPHVELRHKNETFDSLFRRWKKAVDKADTLKILRKYEAFETNGEKRKRAHSAAVKREQRRVQETEWMRLGITPPKPKKEDRKYKDKDKQENSY